jgi:TRAP transporter TAXI family solute receptor
MKQRSLAVCLCIALVFGMSGLAAAKTEFISIGTGGTGGVYYPLGGGIAEVWSKQVPGVQAVAEVTGASVENVKLAHKGETVVGMVMGDVAVAGFEGSGKFEGKKNDVLAMAMLYPNLLQMVVLKSSGITDVMQLKGKKISTGSPGSGTNFMTEAVLKALGFTAADYTDSRLSFTENANALRDGTIDMGSWSVGPGTSSILDLATTHEIRVLSFTPEQTEKILAANSEYAAVDLTGGIYRGVDQPVPTIGVWNVLICQSTLDTELVYKLTKALFENREYLLKIHPSADYTTPENTVAYAPIPLHPGTIKYLTEKGIEVPDKLKP